MSPEKKKITEYFSKILDNLKESLILNILLQIILYRYTSMPRTSLAKKGTASPFLYSN